MVTARVCLGLITDSRGVGEGQILEALAARPVERFRGTMDVGRDV